MNWFLVGISIWGAAMIAGVYYMVKHGDRLLSEGDED